MLVSVAFLYLGLLILGLVPSIIPASAWAAAAPFYGPWVEAGRLLGLGALLGPLMPYVGWGFVLLAFARVRRLALRVLVLPFRHAYWLRRLFGQRIFGGARWARRADLRAVGMTKPGGLFLGRAGGVDLYHNGEGHLLTIGGAGGGKSSGLVVPALCQLTEGSVIVTDPSGELTAMTARRRAEIGPVIYLNPFASVFEADTSLSYPDTGFNPLSILDPASSNFFSDADKLAQLLMVTDRRESGSYWNDEGAEFLSLMIKAVLLYEARELHTLTYIYELVRDSAESLEDYLWHINRRDHPAVKHEAERFASIIKSAPAQWTGVISKVALATKRYAPTTPLGRHVAKIGFDAARLKSERVTVYLLVPSSMLDVALPWLNMLMGVFGMAIGRPGPRSPVALIIDEAPALGYLPDLRAHMAQFRKVGLRVWVFTQTYAALAGPERYGADGMKELMGLCLVKQFFALDEPEVHELVSKMAGQRSVSNPSTSGNMGDVGQPLIRPEEVRGLRKWHQVLFRGGLRYPVRARLVPYFSRRKLRAMVDPNPYMRR
jgi:Type IV secretory pathway, VirD4 components